MPRRRLLLTLAAVVAVACAALAGTGLYFQSRYDRNIERFGDPFAPIPEASRPLRTTGGGVNILLLGSDSRVSAGDPSKWTQGAQRTDAIMVVHIPADRSSAQVVSIPRDSWVPIPGRGHAKVNAAYSYGGPTLLVQTLEKLTDLRIDHVVIADFQGFTDLTDAVGGVQLAGQRMDGAQALAYVRQRHGVEGGDLGRVKRQQEWVRAAVTGLADGGVLTSPTRLTSSLDALTRSIATDDNFSIGKMRSLALAMRDVRPADVDFSTAPVSGFGRSRDGQAIVHLDQPACDLLWLSLRAS